MAGRARRIAPFHVMRILQRARDLEAAGREIVHMEIGEPDFPSPQPVIDAGTQALEMGLTKYTSANGLPELRGAIANSYAPLVELDPERIIVTPGSSGALQLAMALLLDAGDGIMLADPGYPCNRHIASLYDADIQAVPVDASTGYQLTQELVARHWRDNSRTVLIGSPSNPTGTLIEADQLSEIDHFVCHHSGRMIVDEIYHGLVYGAGYHSALADGDQLFVVNSFSKYYGMTGWRIGWLVVPEDYIEAANRLAQNMFLAAPTISQYAALAALDAGTRAELVRRREVFRQRRDYLLPQLVDCGFKIHCRPQGAFYIYADCSALTADAQQFCEDLLEQAGVAITPGIDFGSFNSTQYVRFSYANTLDRLREGVERIRAYLATR
jgi:aspartate/methionine/tyrosine aminotransferase